jgi:hypothetical protein
MSAHTCIEDKLVEQSATNHAMGASRLELRCQFAREPKGD